jgi:predicted transposase/invertase (TIGR01784 family)
LREVTDFVGNKDRRAVFDVYCKNEKGEHILLEMQHIPQDYFLDRSIYYSSFLIQQQGKKGKWDYKLKKIYVIGILNFVPKEMKATGDYIYRVKLCDINTARVISDKLNFIYVNLPPMKNNHYEKIFISYNDCDDSNNLFRLQKR